MMPPVPAPTYVILSVLGGWQLAMHSASIDAVPIYSPLDGAYQLVTDAVRAMRSLPALPPVR